MTRANPFDDLNDFDPTTESKPVEPIAIEQLAQASGFPSRQLPAVASRPERRRYTTGRNQQINIKATPETIGRLYRIADERRRPLGEVLEHALDALERERGGASLKSPERSDP